MNDSGTSIFKQLQSTLVIPNECKINDSRKESSVLRSVQRTELNDLEISKSSSAM